MENFDFSTIDFTNKNTIIGSLAAAIVLGIVRIIEKRRLIKRLKNGR